MEYRTLGNTGLEVSVIALADEVYEGGHYKALTHHAGECLQCGLCESRCPFDVKIRDNMKRAEAVFGY